MSVRMFATVVAAQLLILLPISRPRSMPARVPPIKASVPFSFGPPAHAQPRPHVPVPPPVAPPSPVPPAPTPPPFGRTPSIQGFPPLPHAGYSLYPNIYAEGAVLGYIIRQTVNGRVVKTLDGALQLGIQSSTGNIVNQKCMERAQDRIGATEDPGARQQLEQEANRNCVRVITPWHFSSYDTHILDNIGNNLSLIYYVSYFVAPFLTTTNRIWAVVPANPNRSLSRPFMDISNSFILPMRLRYASGYLDGRIVQAAFDGKFLPTHELVVQIGVSGNDFIEMSVNNSKLFNYILECMATGRLLRIHYIKLFGIQGWPLSFFRGYHTWYRVYRVRPLPFTNP